MPRNLLRVTFVAAIFPALFTDNLPAQTPKPGVVLRSATPSQEAKGAKTGIAGWWQRIRGQKPSPVAAKIVRVSAESTSTSSQIVEENPFEVDLPKQPVATQFDSRSARRRPTFAEFEESQNVATAIPETPEAPRQATVEDFSQPQLNPGKSESTVAERQLQFDRSEIPATVQRGHRTSRIQPASNGDQTIGTGVRGRVESGFEFDEPLESLDVNQTSQQLEAEVTSDEADAYPIEEAAPPSDMNADYSQSEDATPGYETTAMQSNSIPQNQGRFTAQGPNAGLPARTVSNAANRNAQYGMPPGYVGGAPFPMGGNIGVARLDGTMYPAPRPDIPGYVGSTMITNPALDPHEMLYPHRYRGLYGPFYHKTERCWVLTPFGICKHEKRTLVGTEVRVNYKSHISPCSLFFPPVTH